MGAIVYKTLIRLAITIIALIFFNENYPDRYNWIITWTIIFFIVVYPTIVQYREFVKKNSDVLDTICSSCEHFDKSAFLCMKHDKHITPEKIPCEGIHWEQKR